MTLAYIGFGIFLGAMSALLIWAVHEERKVNKEILQRRADEHIRDLIREQIELHRSIFHRDSYQYGTSNITFGDQALNHIKATKKGTRK